MTLFVVEQLAVLDPAQLSMKPAWLPLSVRDWLGTRATELIYTSHDLEGVAAAWGDREGPFKWDPDRRRQIQAEIDGAVLHLYGLDRAQSEWLIDSFTVLV